MTEDRLLPETMKLLCGRRCPVEGARALAKSLIGQALGRTRRENLPRISPNRYVQQKSVLEVTSVLIALLWDDRETERWKDATSR